MRGWQRGSCVACDVQASCVTCYDNATCVRSSDSGAGTRPLPRVQVPYTCTHKNHVQIKQDTHRVRRVHAPPGQMQHAGAGTHCTNRCMNQGWKARPCSPRTRMWTSEYLHHEINTATTWFETVKPEQTRLFERARTLWCRWECRRAASPRSMRRILAVWGLGFGVWGLGFGVDRKSTRLNSSHQI